MHINVQHVSHKSNDTTVSEIVLNTFVSIGKTSRRLIHHPRFRKRSELGARDSGCATKRDSLWLLLFLSSRVTFFVHYNLLCRHTSYIRVVKNNDTQVVCAVELQDVVSFKSDTMFE